MLTELGQIDWDSSKYQDVKLGTTTLSFKIEGAQIELVSVRTPQRHRNKGSARAALSAFLKAAKEKGFSVELCAAPLDQTTKERKLIAFYKSLGFENTGNACNRVGDPIMRYNPEPREMPSAAEVVSIMKRMKVPRPFHTEFLKGYEVEWEHAHTVDYDLLTVGKIVLDHLEEDPKYYTHLAQVHRENPLELADLDNPFEDEFYAAAKKRKVLVYHGTATRWFWPIVQEGFVYSKARKAWENTSPGTFFAFTPSAIGIYANRAAIRFGGQAIAFVLELPLSLLGKDTDDSETWDKNRNWQAMAAEELPPKYITGVLCGWGPSRDRDSVSGYEFTPEIPIRKFIQQVQKGKYADIYGLEPLPDAKLARFTDATPPDPEHAALSYLVDLLQYTSLADHLLGNDWARLQRQVLTELLRMPKSEWLSWTGRQWLAFAEELTGEQNEEPYAETMLEEPRFKRPFLNVASKYAEPREAFERYRLGKAPKKGHGSYSFGGEDFSKK